MRKMLFALVAIFLLATPLYALTETTHGPAEWETMFIKGTTTLTSGSVVVLYTSGTSFPGREVTATTTQGLPIYGVYTGTTTYAPSDGLALEGGIWIPVQRRGYCSAVACLGSGATPGEMLYTSTTAFRAQGSNFFYGPNGSNAVSGTSVTGNCVKLGAIRTNAGITSHTAATLVPVVSGE